MLTVVLTKCILKTQDLTVGWRCRLLNRPVCVCSQDKAAATERKPELESLNTSYLPSA